MIYYTVGHETGQPRIDGGHWSKHEDALRHAQSLLAQKVRGVPIVTEPLFVLKVTTQVVSNRVRS